MVEYAVRHALRYGAVVDLQPAPGAAFANALSTGPSGKAAATRGSESAAGSSEWSWLHRGDEALHYDVHVLEAGVCQGSLDLRKLRAEVPTVRRDRDLTPRLQNVE